MAIVNDYAALLSGTSWSGKNAQNAPVILTYSFATQIPDYLRSGGYSSEGIASFTPFSSTEQAVARSALQKWADVSGIQFVEVTTGVGELVFSKLDFSLFWQLRDSVGYTFLGDRSIGATEASSAAPPGDVLIDLDYATNPYVLLHEIGHALGLKHPFEGTTRLESSLDNHAYTVMSYTGDFRSVLGALDVRAVQSMYGNASSDGTNLASWSWNSIAATLTQIGKPTNDTIFGTGQRDIVRGEDGDDGIAGYAGDDRLDGGSGNDLLFGGDGDDVLVGGPGNDILIGGNSHTDSNTTGDIADYSSSASSIDVDLNARWEGSVYREAIASGSDIGIDTLYGIRRIVGSASGDVIRGSYLAEILSGGDGDDVLRGNGGTDTLDGGAGAADWVDLSYNATGMTLTLTGSVDATIGLRQWRVETYGTVRNIENVLGGVGDDILYGDGLANELHGLGGNDFVVGGAGNDVLRGGIGQDTLDGGAGIDQADYSDKTVAVVAALSGVANVIVTVGGVAEDTIRNIENVAGGSADDVLVGDSQANELQGLGGNDILQGGAGNDFLDGGAGTGDWADYIDKTTAVSVTLNGATSATVTVGGVAEDTIRNIENVQGGSGNDVLVGDSQANELRGLGGNDNLAGGAGNDVLDGGAGQDMAFFSGSYVQYSIVFSGRTATLVGPDGTDVVSNVETFVFDDRTVPIRGAVRNADFNGDGAADILWRNDNGATYLWNSTPAAGVGFAVQDIGGASNDWHIQDAADFNGDGAADILWRNDNGATYLWNSTSAGGAGFAVQDIGGASNDWRIQSAADFNGDGAADILWRNDNGATYLWNSTTAAGGGFAAQDIGAASNDSHIQEATDFNGDGKADILWRNDNGTTYLWNSTPTAGVGFTVQDIGGASNDWRIQSAADFNGDSKADILWRNDSGTTYLWNSTSAAGVGFADQDIGGASNDWRIQGAADFNSDSKADILWRNDNGATYLWNSPPVAGVGFTSQDIGVIGNDWHIQA
ncbi:MAG: VCBS repeat-containing protein [Alphaproteobacteria bacterium]|jgi:Ca2+-binding RTX toxin-like protein|nr:VCBS repeat-containing protein [Alphaproteobacteria bacterium]